METQALQDIDSCEAGSPELLMIREGVGIKRILVIFANVSVLLKPRYKLPH